MKTSVTASPHSCGFCTTGLNQYTEKCLEQETVQPPQASGSAAQNPAGTTKGIQDMLGNCQWLGMGSSLCCVVLAMQKSRSDLVTGLPSGTPQDPCPPSLLLVVGQQPGGFSPFPALPPVVLLWCSLVVTVTKILCCRPKQSI